MTKHQLSKQSLLAGGTPTHTHPHSDTLPLPPPCTPNAQSSHDLGFGAHKSSPHTEEAEAAQQDEHTCDHVAACKALTIHLAP